MIWTLFLSFIQVGLFSVGGGYAAIPLIQDQIVNVHELMTLEQFSDLITIAEMTPGPISINSSTFVGMQLGGIWGVLICSIGCIIPSFIICLTLAHFYYKYRNFNGIQTVLAALRPAVVSLIASAGLSILTIGIFQDGIISVSHIQSIEVLLFAVCLYLLRKFHANPIAIILGSGVVGTLPVSYTHLTLPTSYSV